MERYEAELNYGWQNSHDTYETYHAFEVTDPDVSADSEEIGKKLAEMLDTTPDDDDFNWNSMYVRLPDSLVRKIQSGTINEIMADCGGDREKAHEFFKLWWMMTHGHTLKELMERLEEQREEEPETTLQSLFDDWEYGIGFGGEVWPCFEEFLGCEYREASGK